MGIMNLTSVAVLWFGGHLVADGQMPIGNVTAFLAYILQILMSVLIAVFMIILIPRAEASAERIEAVVQVQPSITTPEHFLTSINPKGLIEFKDVGFGYPGGGHPVLRDLSFQLRPGLTTAIVGGTVRARGGN